MKSRSCAVVGYTTEQFLIGYQEHSEACDALQDALRYEILRRCQEGCRTFYVEAARGTSLWAAELVLALNNCSLVYVLPYWDAQNSWPAEDQRRYQDILHRANHLICLNTEYRKGCRRQCCELLVERADCLLAVCRPEETPEDLTAAAVRYAREQKKQVVLLEPQPAEKKPCTT